MKRLKGRGADPAARQVDDALEGEIVGGLVEEAQIGDRVADFLALVEAQAPDDAISQAERQKTLLEFAGLEAGAHQDGALRQLLALGVQRFDLVADPAGLFLAVPHAPNDDALALARARSTASCPAGPRSGR